MLIALTVAQEKRSRVHRRQTTRRCGTDDHCLHSVDSVHADNLGTCHGAELTAVRTGSSQEGPPKTSHYSRVGRKQDDENALAALQRRDSGSARGGGIAGDVFRKPGVWLVSSRQKTHHARCAQKAATANHLALGIENQNGWNPLDSVAGRYGGVTIHVNE